MSHFRNRVSIGIGGALLLSGLQLGVPLCLAQTAPAPAKAEGAQQMIARRMAMEEQLKRCAQPIDIQVSGATLSQLVKQLQLAMPDASIELRLSVEDKALQRQIDDNKVKQEETKLPQFRFTLEQKPLGSVLQSAATLAGYEFFVMPDELLITQLKELAPGEREQSASWNPTPFAASNLSPDRFAKPLNEAQRRAWQADRNKLLVVGKELLAFARQTGTTQGPFTMQFGDFPPELQQKLQTLVDSRTRQSKLGLTPIQVPSDASIELANFDTSDVQFTLNIRSKNPDVEPNRIYGFGMDISSGADNSPPTYSLPSLPTNQPPVEKP